MRVNIFAVLILLTLSCFGLEENKAQNKPADVPQNAAQAPARENPSNVFEDQLTDLEEKLISLAEAMPAEKYDFAPTNGNFKGVRTFGEQLKHVTIVNNRIFGPVLGQTWDEKSLKSAATKQDILANLKKAMELSHRGVKSITSENTFDFIGGDTWQRDKTRAWLALHSIAHGFDHYGQLVEYARMNGIVPPATLKQGW
jgi:uncharacterized damage-inducible protein DinB